MKTQQNFDLRKSTQKMSLMENQKSGSKDRYDFDAWRNTGTFIGALDYMLQVFYSGEYASEIWHCFRMSDNYQPPSRFSFQALFRDGREANGHVLTDIQKIRATYYSDEDNAILNSLLQVHYIGESNLSIQVGVTLPNGYYLSEEIIQELITIAEKRPMRHEFCGEKREWQEEQLPRSPNEPFFAPQQFTETFLTALGPMLRKFIYFGESTEETRLLFLNMKRKMLSSFLKILPIYTREELIAQSTYYMARGIATLKFLLQLLHIGKDILFIQANIDKLGYHFSEEFIREMIDIEKRPDKKHPMRHKLRGDSPEKESDTKNQREQRTSLD